MKAKISQLEKFLAETDKIDKSKNDHKMRIRAMIGQYEVQESVIKVEVVKSKGKAPWFRPESWKYYKPNFF